MEKYIFCNYDRHTKDLLRWLDPFHSSVDQKLKCSDFVVHGKLLSSNR